MRLSRVWAPLATLLGLSSVVRGLAVPAPQIRSLSINRPKAGLEPPEFAFAFDIDGVLLHEKKPLPGAAQTLQYLNDHSIPFIFLTNGGGKHEHERVKELSEKLGVNFTVDNFVQSHTPFKALVHGEHGLENKTVLVTGADASKCRDIAEEYGFRNVITPGDILVAHPEAWPFDALLDTVYKDVARPLPKPVWAPGQPLEDSLKVDAIMVMHDPRDWAWEIQLFTDLLQSRDGILGTYSDRNGDPDLPNHGWQQDGQPKVYFSNSDLYWVTDFPLRRFGQGAFQHALAGVWERITGGEHELERELYGKPYGVTYQYAEDMLRQFRLNMLTNMGHDELGDLKRVYMVGDNPDSDIAGANNHVSKYGTKWSSILVGTGVWNEQRDGMRKLIGDREPTAIRANVLQAVRWGLDNEGWKHHL